MFSAITSLLQPLVNSAAEGTLPLQVAHCQSSELEFSGQAGDAVELPPLSDCAPGFFSLQYPHDVSVEYGEQSQLGGVVKQSIGAGDSPDWISRCWRSMRKLANQRRI